MRNRNESATVILASGRHVELLFDQVGFQLTEPCHIFDNRVVVTLLADVANKECVAATLNQTVIDFLVDDVQLLNELRVRHWV